MIIVSQDKEKIINFDNVCNLFIAKRLEKTKSTDENYTNFYDIRSNEVNTGVMVLGIYKSKERAKEALQEIVRIYKLGTNKMKIKTSRGADIVERNIIYEMPKE